MLNRIRLRIENNKVIISVDRGFSVTAMNVKDLKHEIDYLKRMK